MDSEEIVFEIKLHILKHHDGLQKNWANHLGCSSAAVSAVVRKIKPPTKAMLNDIGFVQHKKTTYTYSIKTGN